jgi:hypothetical protein
MPIGTSGSVKISDIRNEIQRTGTISINTLQNIALGRTLNSTIKFTDFYGYSYFPIIIENGITKTPTLISGTTYYYLFTSTSGTNTIKFSKNTTCEVLLVGGGGSGASYNADTHQSTLGGGSGGGINYNTNLAFTASTLYTITVGAGASLNSGGYNGNDGNPTFIKNDAITLLSATEGKKGLRENVADYWDGSINIPSGGNTTAIINNVTTQYYGALNYIRKDPADVEGYISIGGGGAGAAQNGYDTNYDRGTTYHAYGGQGFASSITGELNYYSSGGGGSIYQLATLFYTIGNAAGINNWGYGSGGSANALNAASGCVIIRFTLA